MGGTEHKEGINGICNCSGVAALWRSYQGTTYTFQESRLKIGAGELFQEPGLFNA